MPKKRKLTASELPPFMGTEEAAVLLGLSGVCVRKMCFSGRLGRKIGHRPGAPYVISRDELIEFAQKPRTVGRPRERSHTG